MHILCGDVPVGASGIPLILKEFAPDASMSGMIPNAFPVINGQNTTTGITIFPQ